MPDITTSTFNEKRKFTLILEYLEQAKSLLLQYDQLIKNINQNFIIKAIDLEQFKEAEKLLKERGQHIKELNQLRKQYRDLLQICQELGYRNTNINNKISSISGTLEYLDKSNDYWCHLSNIGIWVNEMDNYAGPIFINYAFLCGIIAPLTLFLSIFILMATSELVILGSFFLAISVIATIALTYGLISAYSNMQQSKLKYDKSRLEYDKKFEKLVVLKNMSNELKQEGKDTDKLVINTSISSTISYSDPFFKSNREDKKIEARDVKLQCTPIQAV